VSSLKRLFFSFLVIFAIICCVNIYKNGLIEREIKKNSPLLPSTNIDCSGYLRVECNIDNIELLLDDEMDFEIPYALLPQKAKLKMDILGRNIKSNLYLNMRYLDINLDFISSISGDIESVEILGATIRSKRDNIDIIYEIYRVNFLKMQRESNKDFLRGLNRTLGVDSSELIDKDTFIKKSLSEFLDMFISEIGNSIDLDERVERDIKDFVINSRDTLIVDLKKEF
jgi:hypothetical protein